MSKMPPAGYLTAAGIESGLQYLATTYPALCQLTILPETSWEGRTSRAVKIASGGGAGRRGVLLVAGLHARELVNPDLLLYFALRLCQAYTANSRITFGAHKSYTADRVRQVVNGLDLILFPLVNPDGRTYVQSPTGDIWWRKNRNPNGGNACRGVDLNRNFDFLWSSGIGSSADPCDYQIYKGSAPASEPETRNVCHLLDTFPQIVYYLDLHSYALQFYYPWGDDDDQTTDATMTFTNPAYDGLRGHPGDSIYREYIPAAERTRFQSVATRVTNAIKAVRGTAYAPMQSVGLYPTTATSDDYAYSRHFADPTKPKVWGFSVETGTQFQPPYSEALQIMQEVSAGLFEFCLAAME
jgi:murein tripeptide amidase MpaA